LQKSHFYKTNLTNNCSAQLLAGDFCKRRQHNTTRELNASFNVYPIKKSLQVAGGFAAAANGNVVKARFKDLPVALQVLDGRKLTGNNALCSWLTQLLPPFYVNPTYNYTDRTL
jgi:hypothetical protein